MRRVKNQVQDYIYNVDNASSAASSVVRSGLREGGKLAAYQWD